MIVSFSSDDRGSVTVAAALVLTTLIAGVGSAVEFTRAAEIRKRLQSAADAAVLAATDRFAETGKSDEASRFADEAFRRNVRADRTVQIENFAFRTGDDGEGTVLFDVQVDTVVGSIPFSTFDIVASASKSQEFLDVYLLVDRSDSMLLAEEGPDMDDLMALTKPMLQTATAGRQYSEPEGCAFACHRVEGWEADGRSLYEHAVENGITLRMHRMTNAMREVIAGTFMNDNDTIRVGVVDFALYAELALEPTRDLISLEAALARTDDRLAGVTHYPELADFILERLGPSGTGRRQSDARGILVMATDGAHSWWAPDGGDHYDVITRRYASR